MAANTPEVRSLKDGEYVGVRRFTRILERGPEAKGDLDKVIDRCGSLVNLRTAIMRYRKPRRWFRFYRSLPCPGSYLPSRILALTPTCPHAYPPSSWPGALLALHLLVLTPACSVMAVANKGI